jgi:hypothetical protein
VRIPASARTASNAAVKFEPRSQIMNLARCVCSPRFMIRLRACHSHSCPSLNGLTSSTTLCGLSPTAGPTSQTAPSG